MSYGVDDFDPPRSSLYDELVQHTSTSLRTSGRLTRDDNEVIEKVVGFATDMSAIAAMRRAADNSKTPKVKVQVWSGDWRRFKRLTDSAFRDVIETLQDSIKKKLGAGTNGETFDVVYSDRSTRLDAPPFSKGAEAQITIGWEIPPEGDAAPP